MGALIGEIVGIVVEVIDVAIQSRKSFKEAVADGLEEAGKKIRSGELNIDAAVQRAKADAAKLDSIRNKFRD